MLYPVTAFRDLGFRVWAEFKLVHNHTGLHIPMAMHWQPVRLSWSMHWQPDQAHAPVQEAGVLGEVAVLLAALAQHVPQLAQLQAPVLAGVRAVEQLLTVRQRLLLPSGQAQNS